MTQVLAWLLEHKRLSGEALLALALVALGYWLHTPPACPSCAPAVQAKVDDHRQKQVEAVKDVEQESGPTDKVKLTFNPQCPASAADIARLQAELARRPKDAVGAILAAPPVGLLSAEVIHTGPSSRETHAATETKTEADHHMELKVTPPPNSPALPRFSVFWEPRVLPGLGLGVVGGGIRLTSDFWIEGWAEPTAPAVGLGVRLTF